MHDMPPLSCLTTPNRPDFLILGVQKSATTALFDVLDGLEGFAGSSSKELHFFDNDFNYQKGNEWYLNFFNAKVGAKKFEATPSYIYMREVPGRIYNNFGSMKFIVMLRDPVKRCFSAWNMFRSFNGNRQTADYIYDTFIKNTNAGSMEALRDLLYAEEFPSFEQCVNDDLTRRQQCSSNEEPSFVRRGFYYEQILRFLEFYSLEDFLFLEQEEFGRDVAGSISRICDFLEIESDLDSGIAQKISNKGDYEDVAVDTHSQVFLKLYDLYREPNQKLFSLIGKEYPWNPSWLSL
ncbi:sulfotransferase domain-containing protein [Pseudomonas sp. fls2-241-R2A-110]|uniref:sulfotransferase domain-containing protein n=1 Tax=Pseudomonas sp. fls2-241-R2A-110 TaxID=3040311 RepID=UPI0025554BEA|nr:sulfotransferase domain-containing protein [Pseudomonas sp. fls2-241-R2A-110]